MNKALVHSTESFGSVDGPGIRFIIFLQGCRLRCQYCHNPDTWNIHADGANWLSVSEILDRAERFRSYWRTAGGITVSGGEPLLQIDFLLELFAEAKRRNITTCIDTSAEPFTRDEPFYSKFQALMRLTDTVLLDIKHIDDLEHRRLTGKTNRNILDCALALDEFGVDVWIRHVLVPGITDKDEYLRATKEFISRLSNVRRVDVLPYHSLAKHKYERLNLPFPLPNTPNPTPESVEHAREILTKI